MPIVFRDRNKEKSVIDKTKPKKPKKQPTSDEQVKKLIAKMG